MKWIGAHIWDLVTRFRNTVYLEDLSNAGGDTNMFLVVKGTEDNKVYFRTGPEIVSDLGASDEKGWHGSIDKIKILHSDFKVDNGGRPYMINDSGVGSEELYGMTHTTMTAYATVAIPTGYRATKVYIYGHDFDGGGMPAVEIWEHQINSKTGVSKGTGTMEQLITLSSAVTSSTTNYLFIQVQQANGDEIHGGYVTIQEV